MPSKLSDFIATWIRWVGLKTIVGLRWAGLDLTRHDAIVISFLSISLILCVTALRRILLDAVYLPHLLLLLTGGLQEQNWLQCAAGGIVLKESLCFRWESCSSSSAMLRKDTIRCWTCTWFNNRWGKTRPSPFPNPVAQESVTCDFARSRSYTSRTLVVFERIILWRCIGRMWCHLASGGVVMKKRD
jgi:hypothetical protein